MSLEIEKKYILTLELRERIAARLADVGAVFIAVEFEENIIYQGGILTDAGAVLRIRKTGDRTMLTYKLRVENTAPVKCHVEYETRIENADEMEAIIEALGFKRSLVYEKKRKTWRLGQVEVALDELAFGLYMEIEGPEEEIQRAETLLDANSLETEHATYPLLTLNLGVTQDGVVESRFQE